MNFTASTTTGERTHTHRQQDSHALGYQKSLKRRCCSCPDKEDDASSSRAAAASFSFYFRCWYLKAFTTMPLCACTNACVSVCVCESVKCFFVEAARLPSLRPRMLSVSVVCVPLCVCACVRVVAPNFKSSLAKAFCFNGLFCMTLDAQQQSSSLCNCKRRQQLHFQRSAAHTAYA